MCVMCYYEFATCTILTSEYPPLGFQGTTEFGFEINKKKLGSTFSVAGIRYQKFHVSKHNSKPHLRPFPPLAFVHILQP